MPCVEIADSARFQWRGMHLDVCRHFFPKEFVKKYINLMASYKLNTFHWHLTDDQGWRIEIKKYPALTEIGSKRSRTAGDSTPYGGHYTQQDIRDVVKYARERFVTVVPEIEMPGHSLAALAAYPEFSCSGGPFKVGTDWGVFEDVYCAGNEKTFDFLEDVLTEVIKLFPGDVIHIGGDEVPKTRWHSCPKCQARMRTEGLASEGELQSYFVRRIEKFLNAKGKRIIGWDEILEGGIAPNASVMSWRGTDGGIAAAKAGHDVVMTPGTYCYFDHYQGKSGEPVAIGGYLPIDSVYAYEPVPAELSETEAKHILGAQGNMWTEYIPDEKHVEYMLMPRMLALSEMLWERKGSKDFSDFMRRVGVHYDRLAFRDVNFRVPPPDGLGAREFVFGDTLAGLREVSGVGTIRYTLDGTEPGTASQVYSEPLRVRGGDVLVAKTFLANGRTSYPTSTSFVLVDPARNGLRYAYCEGSWDSLPDFSSLKPAVMGIAYDVALDAMPHREENYALRLTGFIAIDRDSITTWYLTSDDGSELYIDDRLVINNNYLHGPRSVAGRASLAPGKHRIEVDYFQKTGGGDLQLEMEGVRLPRQRVPVRLFSQE
jgi:hexosaminidase